MGTGTRRTALALALSVTSIGVLILASIATASHPRPKGATPLRVPLVVAYEPCAAPNRTHGPPLAFPSCSPPVQSSSFLTVGTPDANGAAANSSGSIRLDVHVGVPGPPNDSEVLISASVSDVRCRAGTTACGSANAVGGPDYTGELDGNASLRMTDHFNAVEPGGGSDPATVVEIPFPIVLQCVSTADTSTGSVCNSNTYCPLPQGCGPRDGDRTVVEIGQFRVFDGGPDGWVGSEDNTLFMSQGLFIP
jgi:hypothetical protein